MTRYDDIISRLERATGPDRKSDLLIFRAFHPEYDEYVEGRCGLVHPCDGSDQRVISDIRWPSYTSSIDAALALVAEKLPGKCLHCQVGPSHTWAVLSDEEESPEMAWFSPTLPLAILRTLFAALKAQEQKP